MGLIYLLNSKILLSCKMLKDKESGEDF